MDMTRHFSTLPSCFTPRCSRFHALVLNVAGNYCKTIHGDDKPGLDRGNGRVVIAKYHGAVSTPNP